MIAFIDDHRDIYGVEPICRVLPIAPSTYHERVAQRQDPTHLSARARQDVALKPEIARVFAENFAVYGVRKVWRTIKYEEVYLRAYASVPEARASLNRYIDHFCNARRPHSSLDRQTPDEAYFNAPSSIPMAA